jgi:hypothetical protein
MRSASRAEYLRGAMLAEMGDLSIEQVPRRAPAVPSDMPRAALLDVLHTSGARGGQGRRHAEFDFGHGGWLSPRATIVMLDSQQCKEYRDDS